MLGGGGGGGGGVAAAWLSSTSFSLFDTDADEVPWPPTKGPSVASMADAALLGSVGGGRPSRPPASTQASVPRLTLEGLTLAPPKPADKPASVIALAAGGAPVATHGGATSVLSLAGGGLSLFPDETAPGSPTSGLALSTHATGSKKGATRLPIRPLPAPLGGAHGGASAGAPPPSALVNESALRAAVGGGRDSRAPPGHARVPKLAIECTGDGATAAVGTPPAAPPAAPVAAPVSSASWLAFGKAGGTGGDKAHASLWSPAQPNPAAAPAAPSAGETAALLSVGGGKVSKPPQNNAAIVPRLRTHVLHAPAGAAPPPAHAAPFAGAVEPPAAPAKHGSVAAASAAMLLPPPPAAMAAAPRPPGLGSMAANESRPPPPPAAMAALRGVGGGLDSRPPPLAAHLSVPKLKVGALALGQPAPPASATAPPGAHVSAAQLKFASGALGKPAAAPPPGDGRVEPRAAAARIQAAERARAARRALAAREGMAKVHEAPERAGEDDDDGGGEEEAAAARVLQRHARGRIARARLQRPSRADTTTQAAMRGHAERREQRQLERHGAATAVQAAARARDARRHARARRAAGDVLRAGARGRAARRDTAARRGAAVALQAAERRRQARAAARERRRAAAALQAAARGRFVRRALSARRAAASTLQAAHRRRAARAAAGAAPPPKQGWRERRAAKAAAVAAAATPEPATDSSASADGVRACSEAEAARIIQAAARGRRARLERRRVERGRAAMGARSGNTAHASAAASRARLTAGAAAGGAPRAPRAPGAAVATPPAARPAWDGSVLAATPERSGPARRRDASPATAEPRAAPRARLERRAAYTPPPRRPPLPPPPAGAGLARAAPRPTPYTPPPARKPAIPPPPAGARRQTPARLASGYTPPPARKPAVPVVAVRRAHPAGADADVGTRARDGWPTAPARKAAVPLPEGVRRALTPPAAESGHRARALAAVNSAALLRARRAAEAKRRVAAAAAAAAAQALSRPRSQARARGRASTAGAVAAELIRPDRALQRQRSADDLDVRRHDAGARARDEMADASAAERARRAAPAAAVGAGVRGAHAPAPAATPGSRERGLAVGISDASTRGKGTTAWPEDGPAQRAAGGAGRRWSDGGAAGDGQGEGGGRSGGADAPHQRLSAHADGHASRIPVPQQLREPRAPTPVRADGSLAAADEAQRAPFVAAERAEAEAEVEAEAEAGAEAVARELGIAEARLRGRGQRRADSATRRAQAVGGRTRIPEPRLGALPAAATRETPAPAPHAVDERRARSTGAGAGAPGAHRHDAPAVPLLRPRATRLRDQAATAVQTAYRRFRARRRGRALRGVQPAARGRAEREGVGRALARRAPRDHAELGSPSEQRVARHPPMDNWGMHTAMLAPGGATRVGGVAGGGDLFTRPLRSDAALAAVPLGAPAAPLLDDAGSTVRRARAPTPARGRLGGAQRAVNVSGGGAAARAPALVAEAPFLGMPPAARSRPTGDFIVPRVRALDRAAEAKLRNLEAEAEAEAKAEAEAEAVAMLRTPGVVLGADRSTAAQAEGSEPARSTVTRAATADTPQPARRAARMRRAHSPRRNGPPAREQAATSRESVAFGAPPFDELLRAGAPHDGGARARVEPPAARVLASHEAEARAQATQAALTNHSASSSAISGADTNPAAGSVPPRVSDAHLATAPEPPARASMRTPAEASASALLGELGAWLSSSTSAAAGFLNGSAKHLLAVAQPPWPQRGPAQT
ncbi:hypothetical protein KFE25_012528 [Diacronema lutheri]|uniref:Uncharacterized protein n=1 Tax=Diacronema lutheri TaxID=2081491 RepID=A0A8J5XM43_DIALT|nr:hypothetical protein KFE25_012528 [Diacronema lutheri]